MDRSIVKDRQALLATERRLAEPPLHGRLRLGVGYPNTYHVACSSLAFQWVTRLAGRLPDLGVERFVADEGLAGRTLELGTPLAELDVLAFSISFELDAVNVVRVLEAAGIPLERRERGPGFPLIVLGGAVASINPLPLSPVADVFCLGAAERVWHPLLELAMEEPDRDRLLERLAAREGYLVPRHHLDGTGRPLHRLRRLEKRHREMEEPALVPASHLVTPDTEYRERGLVEMSRGCPEKCAYCWVSHNYGRLRIYPADHILARVEELAAVTNRIGFVATAVGDHPELVAILERCREMELDVALSSLRIPAMREEILRPLAATGARSITIAPETGSDGLRLRMGKHTTNAEILEAVATAQRSGIESLKMYFIVGLPGETDDDLLAIGRLAREASDILLRSGRPRGRVGRLHLGVNLLIPKPYTPYHDVPMLDRTEARRRFGIVQRSLQGIPNVRTDRPSWRESLWQGYLSRAGVGAFELLRELASGETLAAVLRRHRAAVERLAFRPEELGAPWHFISSAPLRPPTRA
ncbi:MAG: radical SAM protein [Acidobacteria bacterium]|nr:radical SAM protein [Acidobacteriota bacterium]